MAFGGNRTKDANGYLTVTNCVITGEDIAEYWGYEIPGFNKLGLDTKKRYKLYRPLEEIKDANFSLKPFLLGHEDFSAEDYKSKFVIGTVGEAESVGDQIIATLCFWSKHSIDQLEDGLAYLSACYLYDPVIESGIHKGKPYDIRMTNIVPNHIALVDNPRYKLARVADSQIEERYLMDKEDEKMDKEDKETEKEKSKDKAKDKAKDGKACDNEMEESAKKSKSEREKANDEDEEDEKEDKKEKKKPAMDWDSIIEQKVAAKVDAALKRESEKRLAMDSAIAEYERTCGRVNRMAFDSASGILDSILTNKGYPVSGKSLEQKQAMVEMLPSLQKFAVAPKAAMDSSVAAPKSFVSPALSKFFEGRN